MPHNDPISGLSLAVAHRLYDGDDDRHDRWIERRIRMIQETVLQLVNRK